MLLCAGLMIYVYIKDGKEIFKVNIRDTYVLSLFIGGLVLLWMSTVYFPWNSLNRIEIVKYYTNMLQSGNRFLSLAGCSFAFCIPQLLSIIVYRKQRHSYESRTVIVTCVVLLIMMMVGVYTEEKEYMFGKDVTRTYYDEVVGEVEYNLEDYLPSGTLTEWYTSDTGYISDENAVNSLAYEREGTYVYYSYTNSKEGTYVEFPKFYYDGYVAEDEMADYMDVYKGDKNRVRVYLKVTDTPKIIRIWYYVPWYLTLACSISIGLWMMLIILTGFRIYLRID